MAFPQYDEKLVANVKQVLLESTTGKSSIKFESLVQALEINVATRAKMYVKFLRNFKDLDFLFFEMFFLIFFLDTTQFQLAFPISTKKRIKSL